MGILSRTLPRYACISCLPQFKKLATVPTTLGIVVKIVMDVPKIYKTGMTFMKQVEAITSQETQIKSEKVGET